MRGGGPQPGCQRDVSRWHPLPPPSRGGGGVGANCRPVPNTQPGDSNSSSTASSQQDEPCDQPRAVSPRARQAFDLYQECVATGLCARLVLEQKQGGERISFTCRPAAAATYAAVAGGQHRPAAGGQHRLVADAAGGHRGAHNARRAARKRRWRDLKRAATDATAAAVAKVEIQLSRLLLRHQHPSLQLVVSRLASGTQLALPQRACAQSSPCE